MDFQRFFDAFEAQSQNVAALADKVDELRLSNLQLLQAVRRAERLPRVLDPESRRLALRLKEQALVLEREQLRQQRAKKMAQVERELASAKTRQLRQHLDVGALSRVQARPPGGQPAPAPGPPAAGGGASTSLSTEDELNNTVIAKDRLDLFRQVAGTQSVPGEGLTSSLLDQVNLESPSAAANGHEEALAELSDAGHAPYSEDVSVYGATTTGFYTTSTDILQYMRHSTNTITSMFTLQEEEEEDLSSRHQTPNVPPAPTERPNPQPRAVNGERQHLTRYLIEASLPDDDSEGPPAHRPSPGHVSAVRSGQDEEVRRPWDLLIGEQFEAQAELGKKLQEEILAQEERLRAQMDLLTRLRSTTGPGPTSPPPSAPSALSQVSMTSRTAAYPAVVRSGDDILAGPAGPVIARRLPSAAEIGPHLQAKFCRLSALVKGFLTRRLFHSDRAQAILKTVKDTAECALSLSESTDPSGPVTSRRQDAFLHARLVNQLQAALYDFHDLFFATSPAQRMAVIRATRQAQRERERLQMSSAAELELEAVPEKVDMPEKRAPRLSAATIRRMQLREKGQLHNVVNPRFVNKPHEASVASEDSPRPTTAPPSSVPRSQLRVLRPIHLQQQQQQQPAVPAPKPRSGVQRSRSMNAAKPAARPATAPPVTRSQTQPKRRSGPRPVHVVTMKDQGRKLTRKVRAAPSGDERDHP